MQDVWKMIQQVDFNENGTMAPWISTYPTEITREKFTVLELWKNAKHRLVTLMDLVDLVDLVALAPGCNGIPSLDAFAEGGEVVCLPQGV